MAFKTTVKKQRIGHFVAASALEFAGKVRELLANKLASLLREGENLPDVELLQVLLSRFLDQRGERLLAVDDRHTSDLSAAGQLQVLRQEKIRQLRLRLSDARHLLDRQLGRERSDALIPTRNFTRLSPASLVRVATQVATLLRTEERSLGLQPGVGLRAEEVVESLEAGARELKEVIDQIEGLQARRKQAALEEKTAEIDAAEKATRHAAALLAGLYTFVDLPFHAKRLRRRSARKTTMTEEEGNTDTAIGNPVGGTGQPGTVAPPAAIA